jgi:RNA-directed DNA polymerase
MVRYADDFVLLCRSREEAERALERVQVWTVPAGLTLHPIKTRIVDAQQERCDFLGYRFDRGRKFPRDKSRKKFRDAIRAKTRRTNGHSLKVIIAEVNRTLRGWFEYFKHSYKTTFPAEDGWIRGRLRSILRKRTKRRGRARGKDHQRWPNRFFAEQGLHSLAAAHARACQPLRR